MSEKTTKQKISFFSAMMIVVGGSIGAGIFFKAGGVLNDSQGSLVLAIFAWLIASCAVIAMGLALIEIASVRNDNLSLIGWNKVFNSRVIYKASKNFMVYIYLPLTYLFMPIYVIMSLQDGIGLLNPSGKNTFGAMVGGQDIDWLIWTVISLVMSIYFIIVPAIWSKVGDYQNLAVLAVKFIPIILVIVLGMALIFSGNFSEVSAKTTSVGFKELKNGASIKEVTGLGAGLGMFLAIAAIFFAYDGFYVAAGISSEMKEPKKTPLALFLGLGITTIIYLLIAIALSLNGGDVFGMADNLGKLFKNEKAANILLGIMNLMIAIGVMGILNGFSMWGPRYVEDLLADGELPFWQKAKGKLNPNKPWFGVVYTLIITIPTVLVFTVIGVYGYAQNGYGDAYGTSMGLLITFCDLMANWTALFTFAFIAFAITGAIKNRKTNKIEIKDKKKFFLPCAWITVVIVFAAMGVMVVQPIIDMFLLAAMSNPSKEVIISRVSLVVVLFIFIGLAFLPTVFEDMYNKKKYGSVEKFEAWKKEQLSSVEA
ncbi:APC family permease [Mycoplasma sp. Mirounga ES2805-ORL]|uniref:APC family permease n=1 Tax=Mycoplasma sp. Mirounga ES2805-ORL TaxID=754514 RepID=UPI00197BA97A|nr:APC family permease [Mycoplasma sp. Mirounga ES2805-ORL]QSF13795.1 APC family permease [Mycoplasma sp. Mirounga ES2805-ORL]